MDPEGPAPRPRARRRWIGPLIRVPLLIYAGIVAFFFFTQTRLIFPGSQTQGRPEARLPRLPGAELVTLTTERGDRVVALFGQALGPDGGPLPDASTRPTLLYFYGNAMSLRDATDQFQQFRRLGANVMIPEYAGFGMSEGRPGEAGCRETGEAALGYLESRKDVDRSRIVLAGWSLGGAVALDLASRHRVAGVATFCTFTRMADLAHRMLPFLPSSWLLRHRFENLSKIGRVGCPVLIGHGRADQIIPFEMADRLAEAARTPVTRLTIEGADHNDFFDVGGSKVLTALGRFLDALPPLRE
ncbi:alpha/beta hydrolase [Tundrisphaera lichenicola]|uniref:alpha/beta hydrolase n=1 Tax=Tundrisphaera lichenicola TaxID=2029860 RepID=UPI003EBAC83E